MTAIPAMRRISLTLFLTGCAIGLHFAGGLQPRLALQFHEFTMSNVHRVVTCHWLHWSADHLLWDLAVFAVLGAICEWRSPRTYLWTVLLSAITIPLSVMHWLPQVGSYRGLSGIDTALFGLLVSGLLVQSMKERDWSGMLLSGLFLIGLSGKITMEIISHTNIFVSDTSFVPVPLAHLVGAIVGVATGVGEWSGLFSQSPGTRGVTGIATAASIADDESHAYCSEDFDRNSLSLKLPENHDDSVRLSAAGMPGMCDHLLDSRRIACCAGQSGCRCPAATTATSVNGSPK